MTMIDLVDTHCHIQSIGHNDGEETTIDLWSKLGLTQEEVIKRAHHQGVNKLIVVGCNLSDSYLAIQTAQNNDIWCSVGIHPHEAKKYVNDSNKKQEFTSLVHQEKVVAIGECGLDFYYNYSDHRSQREILEFQLDLAIKNNLPVIFHVRQAFDDFWPIINNFKNIRGVIHSFTDNLGNLEEALKRELYIGLNGISTFTKDHHQKEIFKSIPINKLLLETDSPFLTPVPFRGSINEPKNVRFVAEYLASLRGESLETLADQTTSNANKLFNMIF